jgi:hypothetical protein
MSDEISTADVPRKQLCCSNAVHNTTASIELCAQSMLYLCNPEFRDLIELQTGTHHACGIVLNAKLAQQQCEYVLATSQTVAFYKYLAAQDGPHFICAGVGSQTVAGGAPLRWSSNVKVHQ